MLNLHVVALHTARRVVHHRHSDVIFFALVCRHPNRLARLVVDVVEIPVAVQAV